MPRLPAEFRTGLGRTQIADPLGHTGAARLAAPPELPIQSEADDRSTAGQPRTHEAERGKGTEDAGRTTKRRLALRPCRVGGPAIRTFNL